MTEMPADNALAEFRAGIVTTLPAIIAAVPFAVLLGALSGERGLSVAEMGLMSGLVFAGASQFVALDAWGVPPSWWALGLTALVVNLRHALMSASLVRHLGGFPRWARPLALLFMVDEVWAFAEERATRRRLTPAFYAGMVVLFYLSWVGATLAGALAGSLIADPAALGLDFAFIAIFVVLIAGFRRRPRFGAVVAASAVVSVLVDVALPGAWSIMAGAIAGMGAAALLPEAEAQA